MPTEVIIAIIVLFILMTPVTGAFFSSIFYVGKGNHKKPYYNHKSKKDDKQKQKTSETAQAN